MVLFNYTTKEITAKIVYYGPGLCGKTTNLQHVHSRLDPRNRGKLLSLATEADRTLFFDFLPLDLGKISGFHIRFQLYTVPGQVHYNATRRMVLKGVDAVVFVADSQTAMREHNVESYKNLAENLSENGYQIENVPLVLQLNKRDLPNIDEPEKLVEVLDAGHLSCFEAVASRGEGVFETLRAIIKLSIAKLKTEFKEESIIEPAIDDFGPPPAPAPSYEPKPLFSADTPMVSAPETEKEESKAAEGAFDSTEGAAAAEEAGETGPAVEDAEEVVLEDEITVDTGIDVLAGEDVPAEVKKDVPRNVDEFDLTDFDEGPDPSGITGTAADEESVAETGPALEQESPAPVEPAAAAEAPAPARGLEERVYRLAGDVRRLQEENRGLRESLERILRGVGNQIRVLQEMSGSGPDGGNGKTETGTGGDPPSGEEQ
jgi:signal recognition particle receptor subunit beta